MKLCLYITLLVLLALPAYAAAPPPDLEECGGEYDITINQGGGISICWTKNPPWENIIRYIVEGRREGDNELLWEINISPDYCNDYICETDKIVVVQDGVFYFGVRPQNNLEIGGLSNEAKLTVNKAADPTNLKIIEVE